jgi:hypothetical protein
MTAIKLTFICATDSADEHIEIIKYKLSQSAEFKAHARQFSKLIGEFFNPVGALTENGMYELVNVEHGILSDFVNIKFEQV